jgi:hypothetical protein
LEYWNDGIMGCGKMEQWFVRKTEVGIEAIIVTLPSIINLPIFHHSNIPGVSVANYFVYKEDQDE